MGGLTVRFPLDWDVPLRFDVCARANVVLRSEHRIQVAVLHDGQVQLHHLVVLHCEVMAGALYVSPLVDGRGQALSLSETIGHIATSEIFFQRLN